MRLTACALGVLMMCLLSGYQTLAAPKATALSCVLTVDGRDYIKGDCPVSHDNDIIIVGSEPYFAYLILESPTVAEGYWNAYAKATHAHTQLGRLEKNGNCWIGDRAKVCFDPRPLVRFSHAGWIGSIPAGSDVCMMSQRLSNGKAEIVVEIVRPDSLGLGIRWLNQGGADIGQTVPGSMHFDNSPPLPVTGTFVADNYLRFVSQRAGLLEHLFAASSGVRVEFGNEGWFTVNLRGSSKALVMLHSCQSTLQLTQTQTESGESTSGETFRVSDRGIFRISYGTWINVGDEYSRDRIAKFLSGLEVEYQFTYGEDCMECVSVSSGDIQLYFDSGDGKTIQSIHVYGGNFTTDRDDQIGDLVSKNGNELYCSDGMYEACQRYENDNVALLIDRSKCAPDTFKEGVKQPSENFLRKFGQCELIEGMLLERPAVSDTESNANASGD